MLPLKNKAFVLYSGGLSSFASAYLAKCFYGKDNVVLYFNDTKTEDPDLYRFLYESSEWLGLPLLEDSDGRDVWEVFEDVNFIGNSRVDPCSRILKRERSMKYIKSNVNSEDTDIIVGIGIFESHRLEKVIPNWLPYTIRSLLFDKFIDDSWLCETLLKESGIKKPNLYNLGFHHNNCGGFCVKAGLAQFRLLYEKLPERYLYHENREQEAIKRNPNLRPFLKKTEKGESFYLTLREYRTLYLETKIVKDAEEIYDFGSCSCAI